MWARARVSRQPMYRMGSSTHYEARVIGSDVMRMHACMSVMYVCMKVRLVCMSNMDMHGDLG